MNNKTDAVCILVCWTILVLTLAYILVQMIRGLV